MLDFLLMAASDSDDQSSRTRARKTARLESDLKHIAGIFKLTLFDLSNLSY